jgi:hypothetical protein
MTTSTCWPRIGPATYRTTTQEDQVRREANTQVDEHLKASAQVVESAPRTLSRWRHGFEPRWDYEHKGPGQGTSLRAFGRLNRNSKAEYPENIPSRIERSEVRESPRVEGGCTGATASWHPHHCAVHGRTNGHRIGTSWSSVPLPSRSLRRRPPRSVCPLSAHGRGGQGSTGEFGVQVNEGPIAEALVDGLSFRSIGR